MGKWFEITLKGFYLTQLNLFLELIEIVFLESSCDVPIKT